MAIAHHGPAISDRMLRRLVRGVALGLGVLLGAFAVIYYFGQHVDSGPTLIERQVSSAEAAVKATPNNVAARVQLAAVYREAHQPDSALAQYDEVLRVAPTNRSALVGKGETLMANGDLTGALVPLQKVVGAPMTWVYESVDPQLQQAFYDLGSISATQGNYPSASTYLASALKIDATDADSLYLLGTVQLKSGDAAGATVSLQKALTLVPTGWCDPYTALGQAWTKLARPAQAEYAGAMVDFCNQKLDSAKSRLTALTSGPASVDAMLGLAMIAEKSNDTATALQWYRKVAAARPGDFTAMSGLSRLGTPAAPAPTK